MQARYERLAIIEMYKSVWLFDFSASVAIALAGEPSSDFSLVSRSVVMSVFEILKSEMSSKTSFDCFIPDAVGCRPILNPSCWDKILEGWRKHDH